TVFADMVRSVGGDLVDVTSLVPKNGDVHTFEPKPADVRAVARARLLVMNGLGLDDWLAKTITNASSSGTPLVRLAVELPGVTFHDAFPYYAREYGITIVGVAVAAPGQDPSAGYTASLIDAIRKAGVKAIFSESQFPAKLVEQLAAETGTKVVANLYDDALGDAPVTNYEAVIRWDTEQLVAALRCTDERLSGGHTRATWH